MAFPVNLGLKKALHEGKRNDENILTVMPKLHRLMHRSVSIRLTPFTGSDLSIALWCGPRDLTDSSQVGLLGARE